MPGILYYGTKKPSKLQPMQFIRRHFASIDSTNTWVKQNAHTLRHDVVTLITAGTQTAGRGRFKRRWESPPEVNIYATYCIFLEKHRSDIGNLPQVLALSVVQVLEKFGFHPGLKWPNDIILSEKKTGGILCETVPFSDLICAALGIGLNVNMPLEILQKIDRPATSMLVEGNHFFDVGEVLNQLNLEFIPMLELFLEEGFHPFLELYRKQIIHKENDWIKFHDNRSIWEGQFAGINEDGSLNLMLATGENRRFLAGEIL